MRKSRFTEAQIVDIVREYDAGVSPKELARRHGIHVNTIRLWKTKYAGMDVTTSSTATETMRPGARTLTYVASIQKYGQSPSIGRLRNA
jgi:transposase-like protein